MASGPHIHIDSQAGPVAAVMAVVAVAVAVGVVVVLAVVGIGAVWETSISAHHHFVRV